LSIFRKIIISSFLLAATFFVADRSFGQMQFVENKGQWDDQVKYRGDFSSGSFFLQDKGFRVLIHDPNDLAAVTSLLHGHTEISTTSQKDVVLHSQAYDVDFLGASANIRHVPDKMEATYNNYFLGSDPSKWKGDCKIFEAVTYQNVYPNIDVRYYSNSGNVKYDIIVHPGGNIDAIAMRYTGVDKLDVKNKELNIGTSVGTVKELYPYSYQVIEGKRETVDCKYVVKNNVVRFKVKDYSPTSTIVIDPTLIFCSFSGSAADNWGYTGTPGPDGSFFMGGIAFGANYPTSPGAFQTTYAGGTIDDNIGLGYDIAILKLSPDGSTRMYATYLGGRKGNESVHSMMCDAQGNLVIAGRSNSPSTGSGNDPYPLKPLGNTFGPGGNYDIVVTKFNAAGTAIIGSIKVGGSENDGVNIRSKYVAPDGDDVTRRNYGDDARSEVIIAGNGDIWVASCTQSRDFLATPGAPQSTFGGGFDDPNTAHNHHAQDGVILRFNSTLSTVLLSTYFGGSGDDACFVLSQDPVTGNLYVAGGTNSPDLPGDTTGVLHPTYMGGAVDGFVTELKADGTAFVKTSYMGTGGADLVYGIKFDKLGFPYIMGTTTGTWPVVAAPFSNNNSKQFIAKLKPDLSAYVYSTIFGSSSLLPNLSPTAFLVDRCQNVYVSGWGGGINSVKKYSSAGTLGMPEINPLPGIPAADGSDFFFFVLEKNAQSQLFGTHFGHLNGGIGDHVDGGTSRFDDNGIIYQAVCACVDGGGPFPTTPGVWSPNNRSGACNEAAIKIEMNFSGVGASVKATINGVIDTIGCVPLTVKFTDTLAKGKMYIWHYGDQYDTKVDTTYAPNNSAGHTYTQTGNYQLMLVSIDSLTCNIADTAYVTVRVGNNIVDANFNYVKLDSCNSLRYQFNNLSTASLPKFTNQTFLWDFGDGSAPVRAGLTPPVIHTFPSIGTYKVTLIVDDTTYCNEPDSAVKTVRINPNVVARFQTPAIGCVPYNAQFTNTSLGGTDFYWEFGDGSLPTLNNAPTFTYLYPNVGTYNVRLIAIDTSTCNKVDTSKYFTITVSPIPTAKFTWTPQIPIANTPTRFINQSTNGAIRYVWDFGDGENSTDPGPTHQYNATGTYHAVLYAFNIANCVDSIAHDVPIIIQPLLDVPNAFTPGRFGKNAVVSVLGFGIGKMDWRIYNRWGQVVFRTSDRHLGWDGTFKGVLQPLDVYTYTLDVEFTDGQKLRKTGDITLLR